jgi:hypothetical protein
MADDPTSSEIEQCNAPYSCALGFLYRANI